LQAFQEHSKNSKHLLLTLVPFSPILAALDMKFAATVQYLTRPGAAPRFMRNRGHGLWRAIKSNPQPGEQEESI